jgi:hypothetical protein
VFLLEMGRLCLWSTNLSAKYEFVSSNTTRTKLAFDACFVWKMTSEMTFFMEYP